MWATQLKKFELLDEFQTWLQHKNNKFNGTLSGQTCALNTSFDLRRFPDQLLAPRCQILLLKYSFKNKLVSQVAAVDYEVIWHQTSLRQLKQKKILTNTYVFGLILLIGLNLTPFYYHIITVFFWLSQQNLIFSNNRNVLFNCEAAQICKDWRLWIMGVKLQYLPPEVAE